MNPIHKTKSFYSIGISYKKADAHTRGDFSLDLPAKKKLMTLAKSSGISSLISISTCNRTEVYGMAEHPFQLIKILCQNTKGSINQFQKLGYIYKGNKAIEHMFKVGCGLDSQILGDFEIIGQFKTSLTLSKKMGLLDSFLERLSNFVIQASKRVKTETSLSSGSTSVAFTAVRYMLENTPEISQKNILLFGTGKIGRNTCENLLKHTNHTHITLINRTKEKALHMGVKFKLEVKDISQIKNQISLSDILVVATASQTPVIKSEHVSGNKKLLILDLSIPRNVDPEVSKLPHIKVLHLDQLSQWTDKTLEQRKKEIPKALAIIEEIQSDFNAWIQTRKFAPTIKALKEKLADYAAHEMRTQSKKNKDINTEQMMYFGNNLVQKITNHFAHHLKETQYGNESLSLIQQIFQLDVNKTDA